MRGETDASWSALWPPNSRSLPVGVGGAQSLRLPVIVASTVAMPVAFWFTRRVRASGSTCWRGPPGSTGRSCSARSSRLPGRRDPVRSARTAGSRQGRRDTCRRRPPVRSSAADRGRPSATRPCASRCPPSPFEIAASVVSTSRSPVTFRRCRLPGQHRGIDVGKRARRFDAQRVAAKGRIECEVLDAAGPDRGVDERAVGRDFRLRRRRAAAVTTT